MTTRASCLDTARVTMHVQAVQPDIRACLVTLDNTRRVSRHVSDQAAQPPGQVERTSLGGED
jgi:hypothetical protein